MGLIYMVDKKESLDESVTPSMADGRVAPSTCELIPSLRQKKYCNSRDEVDAFVADYMEG